MNNIGVGGKVSEYEKEVSKRTKSGEVYLSNDVVYGKAPLFDPERDIIYKFTSIVAEDISSLEGNYVVDR